MKRKLLIKQLEKSGCIMIRRGGSHDIYINPANGRKQPVPRHPDVNDKLAIHIKKYLGLKEN